MITRLFKDVTATGVHAETAIGNEGASKKPSKKPVSEPKPVDVDKAFQPELVLRNGYWEPNDETNKYAEFIKVDESHGLVLGWAIVCKVDGEDYFDLQDDSIPEASMLKASVDFMQNSRVAKEMHSGDQMGSILFAFPLTGEIAKAFGIETKKTGLMIAMKPHDDAMLAKFKDGTYTGFSIGGFRLEDEEVAEHLA